MKNLILILSLIISTLSFSQTWTANTGGNRYQLTETTTGDYILKVKFASGNICSSKLTVYKSNGSGQYCTEKLISGNCQPWSEVRLVWYDIPSSTRIFPAVELIAGDGFDTETINFYNQ
jgi:hypothetical protein